MVQNPILPNGGTEEEDERDMRQEFWDLLPSIEGLHKRL